MSTGHLVAYQIFKERLSTGDAERMEKLESQRLGSVLKITKYLFSNLKRFLSVRIDEINPDVRQRSRFVALLVEGGANRKVSH